MASQDMHNNVFGYVALETQAITTDTTTNGEIIDTQGFESVEFVALSGTLTDGDYLPLVEDGDDASLSDAAAVSDDFLLGTEADAAFAATDDNTVKRIGYVGHKRYVRYSVVSSSTSSGGTLSAVALLGRPRTAPTEDN